MGVFDQFPYTNFHELNLDWILQALKELEHTIDQFVAINALKYADPIQWDITSQYEKNTIVIDPQTGTAYISVEPVPAGVALTNTDYWTVVFDLGSFVVRAAKNFTDRYEAETTTSATFNSNAGDWIVWGDTLYVANVNITAGDSYVIGGNIDHFTMEDNCGHLQDLLTTDKSNLVNAINEVLGAITVVVGDLNDLNTTDKSNVVNAINEVLATITVIVGDLNDLNTTDKSNVVNAVNEVLSTITVIVGDLNDLNTTDKSTIVNAVNEVLATIGDLNDLNTTDKSNVVNAINEVYALSSGNLVYETINTYNIDNTGATDVSSILAGITGNVGLKAGTYLIDSNCTITAQLVIPKGAVLNISAGVTLTLKQEVLAGRYQIFTGSGSVSSLEIGTGFPEWFGAVPNDSNYDSLSALQKCYAAFNIISLDSANYYISDTFVVDRGYTKIYGTGVWKNTNSSGGSALVCTGTMTVLQVGPTVQPAQINDFPQFIDLEDFEVTRSVDYIANSVGVACRYILRSTLINIGSRLNGTGFKITGTVYTKFVRCNSFTVTPSDGDTTRFVCGFQVDNTTNIGAAGGNASLYIEDCTGTFGGIVYPNSIGFQAYGAYGNADLYLDKFETNTCYTGITIAGNGASPTQNNDILISNCVVDAVYGTGIYIYNMSGSGGVSLVNNYVALDTASNVKYCYRFDDMNCGLMLTNNQAICWTAVQVYGFRLNNCVGAVLRNNTVQGAGQNGFTHWCSSIVNCVIEDTINGASSASPTGFYMDGTNTGNYIKLVAAGITINSIQATGCDYCEFNITGVSGSKQVNSTAISAVGMIGTNLISGVYTA